MITGRSIEGIIEGVEQGNPIDICYAMPPDYETRPVKVVCGRERGHGITKMRLPNGRQTYVAHNTRPDGTGEGWS